MSGCPFHSSSDTPSTEPVSNAVGERIVQEEHAELDFDGRMTEDVASGHNNAFVGAASFQQAAIEFSTTQALAKLGQFDKLFEQFKADLDGEMDRRDDAQQKALREAERLPRPLFTPSTKAELGAHDENITPEQARSERTIRCTPIERATSK